MSVLSITFHCPESYLEAWETYVNDTLGLMAENLMEVDQYILSEVQTEMLHEGKNYNLLLIFANDELRAQFLENEMLNIEERVKAEFGENVMTFITFLNPIQSRKN